MTEKTRFDLVPFGAIGEIADVLAYGAKKYAANNWARGTEWGRYFSAMCRHIFAWWRGEDKDPETGFSHLAHAGCCLLFLMEYQRNDWGTDDRFRGPDGEGFIKADGRSTENVFCGYKSPWPYNLPFVTGGQTPGGCDSSGCSVPPAGC